MGLRFILCLAYAEIGLLALLNLIPVAPNPSTGVIGFPLFANFPTSGLSHWYYAHAIALPLLTLTLHRLMSRRRSGTEISRPLDFELRPVPLWMLRGVVGVLLSAALGLVLDRVSPGFLLWGTLVYLCSLYLLSRTSRNLDDITQRIAVPLCCFVPWLVSQRTTIQIPDQPPQTVAWFPLWLSVVAWGVAQGALIPRGKRAGRRRWERPAVLLGVVPILLFLFHSQLPNPRWFIHLYHDGESLVTGRLLMQGLFPWRDFVFFHGLLLDPIMGWIGMTWLQSSLWGVDAGVSLILRPLSACLLWLGMARLVPKHPILLLLLFFLGPLLQPTLGDTYNLRFLLLPLFWIAVQETISRRSVGLARALGFALGIQFVLAPESIFYLVAVLATVGLFERSRKESRFARTRGILEGGLVALGVLACWLWSHQALGSFVAFHLNLSSHYFYATAIPIKWELGTWFKAAVLIPLLCHVIFTALFWKRWRLGVLRPNDWALFSINLFSILYFRKFIYRADEHILAHHSIALPILVWLLGEALDALRWRLPRRGYPAAVSAGAVICLALAGPKLYGKTSEWASQWQRIVPKASPWATMGFHDPGQSLSKIITDFESFQNEFPSADLYDFTNEPALFYYFLKFTPPSRYLSAFSATTPSAQRTLIQDLEKTRPRFAVFSSRLGYSTLDGVPGPVRHYIVSQYLLAHYRPFRDLGHHLILERNVERATPLKWTAVSSFEPCHWGYAPQTLDRATVGAAAGPTGDRSLAFRRYDGKIELDAPKDGFSQYRFLELVEESAVAGIFSLNEEPSANSVSGGSIAFSMAAGGRNTLLLPVGSCPQWRAFTGPKIYLSTTTRHNLMSARLIP